MDISQCVEQLTAMIANSDRGIELAFGQIKRLADRRLEGMLYVRDVKL